MLHYVHRDHSGVATVGCRAVHPDIRVLVQCCLMSTETTRAIRDGEPRTATSTFTKFLSSDTSCSMLLCVHRDRKDHQDGHLDFHTAPELLKLSEVLSSHVHTPVLT